MTESTTDSSSSAAAAAAAEPSRSNTPATSTTSSACRINGSQHQHQHNPLATMPSTATPPFWETAIPATMISAAAICWIDPSKFPAVFFVFCGVGFLFRDPILEVLTRPISRHLSESATGTVEELLKNEKRFDRILNAGTDALQRTLESVPLRSTLKTAIVESMQDEDLHDVVLATTTNAIVKASKDDGLRKALTVIAKHGVLEALRDEDFMKDIVASLVRSIVASSQDPELKEAILVVATEAVSTALQDEKFVAIFRQVMKDCLSDGALYRAGATGLIGAFTGKSAK